MEGRMRNRLVWKICGVAIALVLGGPCSGQTAPTDTWNFRFPIECWQMADKKADSLTERMLTAAEGASIEPRPADVALMNKLTGQPTVSARTPSHASTYDAKGKRCFIWISE
jgi:hypothetical protein